MPRSNLGGRFLRSIAFFLLLIISVVLPIYLAYESIAATVFKLNDAGTTEYRAYERGCIVAGELWFPVSTSWNSLRGTDTSIRKLDLKTGVLAAIELDALKTNFQLTAVGDAPFASSFLEIRKLSDPNAKFVAANDDEARPVSNLFSFQGKPSCLFAPTRGAFWLASLEDDQWTNRRDILLPEPGVIIRNPQDPEQLKLPLALQESNGDCVIREIKQVIVDPTGRGDEIYIMARVADPQSGREAIRLFRNRKIEITKNTDDLISAMLAESNLDTSVEWEETAINPFFSPAVPLIFSPEATFAPVIGPFGGGTSVIQLRCRKKDGSEKTISGLSTTSRNTLMCDPVDGSAYIIEEECDRWNTASIRRIEDDSVGPVALQLGSAARRYIDQWRIGAGGIWGAWLLHYAIVTFAVFILRLGQRPVEIEFDLEQATLTSVSRRLAAATLDLAIFCVSQFLLWSGLSMIALGSLSDFEYSRMADRWEPFFSTLELNFRVGVDRWFGRSAADPTMMSSIQQSLILHPVFYSIGSLLTLLTLRVLFSMESRFGVSPGKWLTGIRCTRADFTAPGAGSSLIRSSTRPFEFLLFLTPIPAMFLLMLSNRRFGDFLAETIVIKQGSVRAADLMSSDLESVAQ